MFSTYSNNRLPIPFFRTRIWLYLNRKNIIFNQALRKDVRRSQVWCPVGRAIGLLLPIPRCKSSVTKRCRASISHCGKPPSRQKLENQGSLIDLAYHNSKAIFCSFHHLWMIWKRNKDQLFLFSPFNTISYPFSTVLVRVWPHSGSFSSRTLQKILVNNSIGMIDAFIKEDNSPSF